MKFLLLSYQLGEVNRRKKIIIKFCLDTSLEIIFRKKKFGKSDFFPKILNFCRTGLLLAKTFWMIVSPQKRVKKIPTICTCQTFIYYVNWLKTNFEVIFKAHFRAKKISKIIMDPQTFKTHHRLSGNAELDGGFSLSLSETAC